MDRGGVTGSFGTHERECRSALIMERMKPRPLADAVCRTSASGAGRGRGRAQSMVLREADFSELVLPTIPLLVGQDVLSGCLASRGHLNPPNAFCRKIMFDRMRSVSDNPPEHTHRMGSP